MSDRLQYAIVKWHVIGGSLPAERPSVQINCLHAPNNSILTNSIPTRYLKPRVPSPVWYEETRYRGFVVILTVQQTFLYHLG
jgi:hypothetical protein